MLKSSRFPSDHCGTYYYCGQVAYPSGKVACVACQFCRDHGFVAAISSQFFCPRQTLFTLPVQPKPLCYAGQRKDRMWVEFVVGSNGLPLASLRSWQNYFCACESFSGEATIQRGFSPGLRSASSKTFPPRANDPSGYAGYPLSWENSRHFATLDWFPCKTIRMTCHYPDLHCSSDWLKQFFN